MSNAIELVLSFFLTWVVGLSPALIARYVWKKAPLSGRSASVVAGLSCVVFAFGFLLARSAAGETDARISPAWILVFIVSRWIMMRGTKPHLGREEIVFKLREMIADPQTSGEKRSWAENRLQQYERLVPTQMGKEALAGAVSDPQQSRLRRYSRPAAYALGVALILDILLMTSRYRLLLNEKVVQPGETYMAGEWDDVGTYGKPVVVCWYWTGRSIRPTAEWYGVGKNEIDECPLLKDPD